MVVALRGHPVDARSPRSPAHSNRLRFPEGVETVEAARMHRDCMAAAATGQHSQQRRSAFAPPYRRTLGAEKLTTAERLPCQKMAVPVRYARARHSTRKR